jgi:hypothetical protein
MTLDRMRLSAQTVRENIAILEEAQEPDDAGYYPKCKKCGCELRVYVTKQGAEKAWNRRATDGE